MIEPDENAVKLVRASCDNRGPGETCDCPAGICNNASAWEAAAWMETARALKVPTAALLALARGDAAVVPRWLTPEMSDAIDRAPSLSYIGQDGNWKEAEWNSEWLAALDASPYEGGA